MSILHRKKRFRNFRDLLNEFDGWHGIKFKGNNFVISRDTLLCYGLVQVSNKSTGKGQKQKKKLGQVFLLT